jgi:predicted XRE-type DNA-binding protein
MDWERDLFEAGVEVHAVDARRVRLVDGDDDRVVRFVLWARPPRPSEMPARIAALKDDGDPVLVVAPRLSTAVRGQLERAGAWYVADGVVSVGGVQRASAEGGDVIAPGSSARGLPFRGRSGFQVVRRILERGFGTSQRQIAEIAHVSQPRVSQTLRRLRERGLLVDSPPRLANLEDLLDRWLASYPGPGGVTTSWYSLEGPREAASAATKLARSTGVPVWLSGDVAADLIAPWARPTRAVVYAERALELTDAGMVRTPGADGANLLLVVADDPTVSPVPGDGLTEELGGRHVDVADVLQVLWDTSNGEGADVDQAVEVLRRRLLDQYLHGT